MPASSICDDLSNGGVLVGVSVSGSVLFWCFYYEKTWREADQLCVIYLIWRVQSKEHVQLSVYFVFCAHSAFSRVHPDWNFYDVDLRVICLRI